VQPDDTPTTPTGAGIILAAPRLAALFFSGNLQNFTRISHRTLSIASANVRSPWLFAVAGELAQKQQAKMMPHGNFGWFDGVKCFSSPPAGNG
jgi:hypothetical protein